MEMETKAEENRIVLNISGSLFETWESTLERYPSTLLGSREKRNKYFHMDKKQYFFHRNRTAFEAILYFYQSEGRLDRPYEITLDIFEEECNFFELPYSVIRDMKLKEGIILEEKKKVYEVNELQKHLWEMVEMPETSLAAKMFAAFSLGMIFLSLSVACLETIPSFDAMGQEQFTTITYLEYVLNGWFLFELLLRLTLSPNKYEFFHAPLNWIDILAVIPYFILRVMRQDLSDYPALKTFQFVRIIRLLRLGRHSNRMKIVGRIFMSSFDDIKQLLLCLILVVVFGGSIVYFTEMDRKGTQFTSIPQSLWWAIQTVVVLGYGDIVPQSFLGKAFASFFMVFGALTIALPVLSVVTKFTSIYAKNMGIKPD